MSLTTPKSSGHLRNDLGRDREIDQVNCSNAVRSRVSQRLLSFHSLKLGLKACWLGSVCLILLGAGSVWGQEGRRTAWRDDPSLPPLRPSRELPQDGPAEDAEVLTAAPAEAPRAPEPIADSSAPVPLSPPRELSSLPEPRGLAIEPPREAREPRATPFSLPADVPRNTLLALGLVIGSFLVLAWFVKRHQPRSFAPLPPEVVELLGRVPMDSKHHLQLIRLGRKLVLTSVSSSGCTTLAEVTEPAEVEHLLALCHTRRNGSATEAFRQVLTRAEKESTGAGFLGEASSNRNMPLGRDEDDGRRRRAWFEA